MDFPGSTLIHPVGATIHSASIHAATHNQGSLAVVNYAAAAWPSANLGIFIPFSIDYPATAKQMFWENGAVAGTTDIGIYDELGTRLVSLTATTNAGTIQIANIADTLLGAGSYYMGMVASTVTTQTYWSAVIPIAALRACGVQQQAIGSATLPSTATFAAMASAYLPFMGIAFQATI